MPKPYVAINQVIVKNEPKTFEMFQSVGPKVCMTTARHKGFVGFQNHIEIGVVPMGTRYGAAKMDMLKESSTMGLYQYTMWKDWKDHEEMHKQNWSSLFRLCYSCMSQVVWGPWEPLYEITMADMPLNTEMTDFTVMVGQKFASGDALSLPPISQPYGKRVVTYGEHVVKEGMEKEFEETLSRLLPMFKRAPGFLGYMVLKEIGASPLGSLQLSAKSWHQMLESANGMDVPDPNGNFSPEQARNKPQKYVVHMEWSSTDAAQFGLGRVFLSPEYREIHDQIVDTLIYGPYIRVLNPVMEGSFWREYLNEVNLQKATW
ncbi:sulfur oxygenase/reductase [Sulfuracidifex metallicus]|uniref:sulfur oxygenase/reductase n=1 Tax=Sulfuracidifex metallicus TaxID=47303 RepID=UPI0022756628|nr:sulfur oxygenase reductase family protein [Sulfuracidifex metallicus]MCY0849392.1 sulfur oxygenase reductase family protein [Sulfuracidifex metallicus]